jgi:protein-L-isoaspartate(D-aspartate) O-methyltransferase
VSIEARKIRLVMHLRKSGITDTRVLSAIERVPREAFLPEHFLHRAYEDSALPIGHGQTISQPLVVAKMTQELELEPTHRVLEVGTGSGYQAAVLSCLVARVWTIERHKPLLKVAKERFQALAIDNITARAGDGSLGWPGQDNFDRMILTAAAGEEPPPELLKQLALGGIMMAPLTITDEKGARSQKLVKLRKTRTGLDREEMWPVKFVPLVPGEAQAEEVSSL